MRNKIWRYKARGLDMEALKKFSENYRLPPVIAAVLFNRGITSGETARLFLQKPLDGIHNPYDLPDMDKAVERIKQAIENNEKIVIYGDYDVDGITSTVLLYSFLKKEGADVDYYIPDRIVEGYGINIMAINKIAKSGANLLITVDCGITAIGEVEFALTQKLDIIITDHHTCRDELPRATAVINPKRKDSEYPFEALAGVGVAFKLVLALAMKLGENTRDIFMEYVELAAIGTIADVVSVMDENRIIIDRGLEVIKTGRNPGIHAILEVSGALSRPITERTIGFAVAPRLNAAGRLGNAKTAVELLLCANKDEAEKLAKELDSINRSRQEQEQLIFEDAMNKVMNDPLFDKKKVIVLAGEKWHHGVIGIVASRICERFYKPCILISYENGIGKGSGRSVDGFDLFKALCASEEYLTNFGGHTAAAGLGINMNNIEQFTAAINKYADKVLTDQDLIPKINIDCRVKAETVTLECAKALEKFEPYGMDNEKPIFSFLCAKIMSMDIVGSDKRHLRLKFLIGQNIIPAIGFDMADYEAFFNRGDIVDIAFSMDINNFQGTQSLQLMVKDIKKHSTYEQERSGGER